MRDFFSFLREIFFYNQKLDVVDTLLAEDMLHMLNEILRTKSEQLSLDCLHGTEIKSQSIASLVPLPGS
jgi:hypothetical protein